MKRERRKGFKAASGNSRRIPPRDERGRFGADPSLPPESQEALRHFRDGVSAGLPWHVVLLEAIGLWTAPQEVRHGKLYCYLIGGEAFDLFHLAQRLCEEVDGFIPVAEREALFQTGRFPQELSELELKELIGLVKYRSYLNYWYGVTVEQGLEAAVRSEIRKERLSRGLASRAGVANQAFARIYGEPRSLLIEQFRSREGPGHRESKGPIEVREFTYWLFKQRLQRSEKARLASDTRKALLWLQRQRCRQISQPAEDRASTAGNGNSSELG